jgi:hypothetical protein
MYGNFGMYQNQHMYQQIPPIYQHMYQQMPMRQQMPPMYQQMHPMYHQRSQFHAFGGSDIEFIQNNNIPFNTAKLLQKKDSVDILDCVRHRKIQETLRDKYGHKSDQIAWDTNCKVIHQYDDGEYDV